MLHQSEAAECGIACLAMVACYFGQNHSLSEIRRRFSASLKGTTLKAIMDMADGLGLSSRPVRLELSALNQLRTPAILHWDLKHYVVLKAVRRKHLIIHDPARGVCRVPFADASRGFTGVALELTPTPAFEPKTKAETVRLRDLFSRARGVVPSIGQLLGLAFVLQLLALLSPVLNQTVVDDVMTKGDADLLGALTIGMIGLLIINQSVSLISGHINLYLGAQLSYQMQSNLLRHVLRLPVSWFENRRLGDMLSRFNSLGPAQSFFTTALSAIVLSSFMAVLSLTMMVLYSPLLTGLEVASIIFFFLVRLATFPWYREKQVQNISLGAKVQSTFIETLRGARIFKAFGRERERVGVWQNEQAALINNNVSIARANIWGGAGIGVLSGLQTIIVWYLGARMVIDGKLTLGMLVAFQTYTGQFTGSAESIVGQYFSWRSLGIHLERLADVTNAETERSIDMPAAPGRRYNGSMSVRDLSFRYAAHESWILRNVNFDIRAGEFVCFVGPSGQGKTTLIKLLLGFYDPQEGQVMVDNEPIRSFGIRTFREGVGVVMQDDQLFSGTIADNIAFFEPEVDMSRVEEAARAAQVHDDIVGLPMGYLSLVGDMGSTLSGGQKQRVFLARALYRKPKILFLDEGTANLDAGSEERVMDVLVGLNLTRIFVAHRAAAIAGASRIFEVRDQGVRELEPAQAARSAPARSPLPPSLLGPYPEAG